MNEVFRFAVAMEPFGQQRHRTRTFVTTSKSGKPSAGSMAYSPNANKVARKIIQIHAVAALRLYAKEWDTNGPMRVTIAAFWKCPRPLVKSIRPASWRIKKPDADNIAKSVLDALGGILFLDDNQICDLRILKIEDTQGRPSRIEVKVERIEEPVVDMQLLAEVRHGKKGTNHAHAEDRSPASSG